MDYEKAELAKLEAQHALATKITELLGESRWSGSVVRDLAEAHALVAGTYTGGTKVNVKP